MGALSNLKILDFSTLLPGPFATMMLSDLGANVIRVENLRRPDLCRDLPPFSGDVSTKHGFLNRNKRSIALDLKIPSAIELIKRLVQDYDIIVEQFRPGVMDRLGLGYSDLKAINPKLIYCSISGYGQTGDYSKRAGHDINYLSISGVNGYSGRRDEAPPIMGIQIADIAGGGLHGVIGMLAAINERNLTGEGQHVDISMTDATFSLNAMFGADYLAAGESLAPESNLLNGGTYYDYYETSDHRYMSVGSIEPQFFNRLCEVLGLEDNLHDENHLDFKGQRGLRKNIKDAFSKKTFSEWIAIFDKEDVCVEPVLTFAEACMHSQIQHRNMIVEVPAEKSTAQRQIACPIKLSGSPAQYKSIGGGLGADNYAVLVEAGLSEQEITAVLDSGAMA